MSHPKQRSFITDNDADRMGAEMAIQFMLMALFQVVSEMADDAQGLRASIHEELTDLVATHKLPPMPDKVEKRIRATATRC